MKKILFIILLHLTPLFILAQISYHDIIPDKILYQSTQPDTFKIDIDGDQIYDIGFFSWRNPYMPPIFGHSVISYNASVSFAMNGTYVAVKNLYDTIKNNVFGNNGEEILAQYNNYGYIGNWLNGVNDKFLGFRHIIGSDTLFGYFRLSIPSLSKIIVHDYAFETISHSNIYAGQGINHAVKNISVSDIGNQMNGNDLSITLEKAIDESSVSSYRVMVVPSNLTNTFNIDSALLVSSSSYKTIIPSGNDTTFIFGSIINDVTGEAICDLKPYIIFMLSAPDGINTTEYALSIPSSVIELRSVTQTVTNLFAEDVADNNSGSDIKLCFSRISCESCIKNYRLFILNNAIANTFSIDSALAVPAAYYIDFDSTSLNPCFQLPSLVYDIYGIPIQNGILYRFFILSVPDTIHSDYPTLSSPSKLFMLETPDIFVTGDTTGCLFTDFSPDITYNSTMNTIVKYYIDLNNDQINDFYFELSDISSLGNPSSYIYFVSLNGNQFLTSNSTSLYLPLMYQKELLFDSQCWTSGIGYLCSYNLSSLYQNIYHGNWVNISDGYLGFRLIQNNDTLYGWINVSTSNTDRITIKSFSLQKIDNSIQTDDFKSIGFSISPNPAVDYLEINCHGFDLKKANCSIINVDGSSLYFNKVSQNIFRVNTKQLPSGMYFIKMEDGTNIQTKKIIKKEF